MKKTILITGTSKWLGKYVSENLQKDYQVFWVARSFEKNPNLELGTQNYLDLTNFQQIDNFCEKLAKNFVTLDAVIFNAGKWVFGSFWEQNETEYKEILTLNLIAPIIFLQKLLPLLQKDAKIIFIGSVIGKKFLPHGAVYGASKFGLRGFAGILNKEYKHRVHIINPRILPTDFHNEADTFIPENEGTSLESVFDVVRNILNGTEKRFEIDL